MFISEFLLSTCIVRIKQEGRLIIKSEVSAEEIVNK